MTRRSLAAAKGLVWIASLAPLALLVAGAFGFAGQSLGPNPVEFVLHTMGKTALNLLLITLAVTPARRLTGYNALVRFRRLLGLFSFFYLVLHFLAYALLDLRLEWSTLFDDIVERPYITVGMLALAGMIPLAVTSTQKMQRRLGRRWGKLHQLIYPIAVLGMLHFLWQTKSVLDPEPWIYIAILTVLLGYRVAHWLRVNRARRAYQ
jgi:methionine sulfoxide reductase heme-binding subunit